jgi:hypothetical protein
MRIGRAIRLRFQRASQPHSTVLLLGSSSDHDSGGFVVAELVRNLQIYIPEKLTKVAPFRHRYPEWWLAFEDRISYGSLDQEGLEQLRQALGPITGFERVVLVNPLEHARAVQIHPSLNAEA